MDKFYLATYSFGMGSGLAMPDMLKAASDMGYAGVELSGNFMETPADDMKRLLMDNHLEAVSAHVSLNQIEAALPYLQTIGVKMAIVPMYFFATLQDTRDLAGQLNDLGQKAKRFDIKIGYHNHTGEFYEVDGKVLLDHLIDLTDPELVGFELDCGWAAAAGIDPADYISRHKGRILALHIKEVNRVLGIEKPQSTAEAAKNPPFKFDDNGKPILSQAFIEAIEARNAVNVATGEGIVDWARVRDAALEAGCEIFILEREHTYHESGDRVKCLEEDVRYLKDSL